ncbi:MAG TPA: hypothetical protein GXX25_07980 [Desulfotomaculum sp.]|nr:hypothetical protein [Desulfotomaculum sp.]
MAEGWSFTPGKGEARWVVRTRDGGYVVTGWTESGKEGSDVFLARLDKKGNRLWIKTYKGNGYSCGYCVQEVNRGGFIVVGDTKSKNGYDHDVYVVQTDEKGEPLWEQNFGGQYCDYAWSVRQTKDGGYILAGGTESFGAGIYDVYLIKLDSSGQELWEKTYGGKGSDCGYAVLELDDGGYLIAGNTESFGNGNADIYLLRTDPNGQLIWQKTYGGKGSDYAWSLAPCRDGSYVIAGEKEVAGRQGNILAACLIKVDRDGNELWEKTYGDGSAGSIYAVYQEGDGGHVLAGKKESTGGGYDIYLVKTDKNGDSVWEKTTSGSGFNCACSIVPGKDGEYVLAGRKGVEKSSQGDIFVLQLKEIEKIKPALLLCAGVMAAVLVAGSIIFLKRKLLRS